MTAPGVPIAAPAVPGPVPAWQPWAPDRAGLARLRRWRTPRRPWLTEDVAHPDVAEARLRGVLDALAAADRHAFALVTVHPDRLRRAAIGHYFRHAGAAVPAHVLLAVVVAQPETFFDLTGPLPYAPAGARGLVLRTARVGAALVAPLLSPPGGPGISRVLVEREMGAALPRWARDLREAGAASRATLERVPGALLAGLADTERAV